MSQIQRLHVGARLSEVAIHNGTVYLAGQIPDSPDKDIAGQTAEALAHVERLLKEAGSDKSRILMAQIFLADLADLDGMNSVWDTWVVTGHTPPRATVNALLANPQWRIEVVVTAAQA